MPRPNPDLPCVIFKSKDVPDRVLVVEDDYLVTEILFATLKDFGLEPLSAGDGESALALLSVVPAPVRLAIVDLRLPGGMSGAELARMIRASGTATVLMSADHEWLDEVQKSDASAVCLAKPFSSAALLNCIARSTPAAG